eukprot:4725590-Lingulodinium_polyedra.AAC.1
MEEGRPEGKLPREEAEAEEALEGGGRNTEASSAQPNASCEEGHTAGRRLTGRERLEALARRAKHRAGDSWHAGAPGANAPSAARARG